jgi:hypothetical protein
MESICYSNTSNGESEPSLNPDVAPLHEVFSLTAMDTGILKGYLQEFQASSTEARQNILETTPSGSVFDKKMAKQVRFPMFFRWFTERKCPQKIQTWCYNHYDCPHCQLIWFTWRWSARNSFYHQNKAEITELTKEICGDVLGSQAFFGVLQDATNQIWKRLSNQEQVKYRALKEWSDDRPPKHIQAKYVILVVIIGSRLIHMVRMASAPYRHRIVRDLQTQLYKTCGVHSVMLVAYPDESRHVMACM